MGSRERISRAFESPLRLPLTENSKYLLLSDCHRGIGDTNDNFLKNEFLYLAALEYYFKRGFTYIELGDGDELWENRSLKQIKEVHKQSFEMIAKYYGAGRMYSVYGNHDTAKKNPRFAEKYFHTYFCDQTIREIPLCPGINFYSGIILQDRQAGRDIYLTHGHQADWLNSTFWRLSRFLVRYVWKPLEHFGVSDPTSAAKNNTRKKKSEKILADWAARRDRLLIAGHTHHPMIGTRESPYFNTGSCIHPGGITGIEIENRCMTLVKWSISTREDQTLYAARSNLSKKICIDDYGSS